MISFKSISQKNYFKFLSTIFIVEAFLLGIAPAHRLDWLVENILTIVLLLILFLTVNRLPMSRVSYTLIFIFLSIHQIGSHYTYSKVPIDAFFQWFVGYDTHELFGWQRNNFDRIVHFSYGLLLAYPIREVYLRVVDAHGFWGYFLPLDFTMSTSLVFEFMEWGVFEYAGGDLGVVHLGMQGDIWDAHKDMLCASIGAFIAMVITAWLNSHLQKDFAREWSRSLTVKHKKPLGEAVWYRFLNRLKKNRKKSGETDE